jgi:DNA-binding MarR family transcriptional regulator
LGIASGVPQTTALRWIKVLEREGHIKRVADAKDRRRFWLELTDDSKRSLHRMFATMKFVPVSD